MLGDILLQVNKPGRYIGNEWNVSRKDFDKAEIKFALCFPDLYEVGMSNLGIRIIYGLLNSIPDVVCERFFSCSVDLENILRNNKMEIFSLESKKSLKEFDFVGFSLGYELAYTNVLNILDFGSIPLKSTLRDNSYPLVIGGGPCVLNPEPMHDFFDLFIIGEAEEAILEVIDLYRRFKSKFKSRQINKQELLVVFSNIKGVYAPSLYEVTYEPSGKIKKFSPKTTDAPMLIKKRIVSDLNKVYFPLDWLIPYIQIIHDRITLEVMRGCPNTCRFCQARSQYFPFRKRSIKKILDLASTIYRSSGYEEISLCGLSVSDYKNIAQLLESIFGLFKDKSVSISFPSIKPNEVVGSLSSLIADVKKTGLTFAPEAATERLRQIMGKHFDAESFFKILEQAYACGYQHVKLYFMIGLPSEEEKDLNAILEFAHSASELRKKVKARPAQVNLSINALIPKPHTPLQWLAMENLDNIKYKQEYLFGNTKNKRLRLRFHNPRMSFLEGVLSRGDRRLSNVILDVFKKGAKFDSWEESSSFGKWIDSFKECGLDPCFYLKEKPEDEYLPWDFLDIGIDKEVLRNEFNKLLL